MKKIYFAMHRVNQAFSLLVLNPKKNQINFLKCYLKGIGFFTLSISTEASSVIQKVTRFLFQVWRIYTNENTQLWTKKNVGRFCLGCFQGFGFV